MAGGEAEVLELVALIHKDMVDTHHAEVNHIVGTLTDSILQLLQCCLLVALALLQSATHLRADAVAHAFQQVEGFVQLLQFVID